MATPTELTPWSGDPEALGAHIAQDSLTVPLLVGALRVLQLELQGDPLRPNLRTAWENAAEALCVELAELLPFYGGGAEHAALVCYVLRPPTQANWEAAREGSPEGVELLQALFTAWGLWLYVR